MSTSDKQIEANRRNAQLSTGPTSPEGKLAVRLNALTHGILARETVITGGDYGESELDFETHLAGLHTDLAPQGSLETLLVQEIAVCYWRLRRALRADMREFDRILRDQHDADHPIEYGGITVRRNAASLPPADTLANLTRYETTIHNQLQRALTNLARLQGEHIAQSPATSD